MLSRPSARSSLIALVGGLVALAAAPSGAAAQNSGCGDLQGHLVQRKGIADKLTAGKGKKLDARVACAGFGQLVANGNTLIKWTDANKDWCQIPESFVQSIKTDHAKAMNIRGQACGMVAKQAQMEKQAREGGGSGLLGGGGLTGQSRMPQGAL